MIVIKSYSPALRKYITMNTLSSEIEEIQGVEFNNA